MKTRPSVQNRSDRSQQQEDMGTQTPKAAGSNPSTLRPAEPTYAVRPAIERKRTASVSSTWHGSLTTREAPPPEERRYAGHGKRRREQYAVQSTPSPSTLSERARDIPEELAEMIVTMIPGSEGENLAEAFREGSDQPPITLQSLSELDIRNIITNIKLRHDVNFDRDLSFRPNLDGAKGQEKFKAAQRYWRALVAEMELYTRLFRGTPPLQEMGTTSWSTIIQHAERRIPKIFETVRDVLKSLVPDRDHSRVDEHLDVPMLMQEIERGVCDLVRLSEWMASLLKEHCAPMRDEWVDKMVSYTRTGVEQNKSESIVKGLCELLGILESMKLDVANHQIRNLKTLLIEDTVNFETHYHLERLVNGRTRVDVQAAQQWYGSATDEFGSSCTQQEPSRQYLEVFVRGVTATLFGKDGRSDFPETLYLDTDRLQVIKAEIEDHVFFEVCLDMHATLLKQFNSQGSSLPATRQRLISSLTAIMGDFTAGYGPHQWMANSEALSLEILRQACDDASRALTYDFDTLSSANQHLRHLFFSTFTTQARNLETTLLPMILATMEKHNNSSPMELFNDLVPSATLAPSKVFPVHPLRPSATDAFSSPSLRHPDFRKLSDIANRISHIIIMHWRVWSKIAYLQDDATAPRSVTVPATQTVDAQVPSSMRTGETIDCEPESRQAPEASSQ